MCVGRDPGFARAGALALAVALGGCELRNPGIDPPAGRLHFPVALTVTPDGGHLLVLNSNFDLRYNAGTLQAFDLDAVDEALDACSEAEGCELEPGELLARRGEVLVGSYGAAMTLSPSGERVLLAMRAEGNLTYVEWSSSHGFFCGGSGERPRCGDAYRRGDESTANEAGATVPGDPVGIVAGDLTEVFGLAAGSGTFALMAHGGGQLSLFLDETGGGRAAPVLVDVASVGANLVGLRLDARSGLAWLPTRSAGAIGLATIGLDAVSADPLDAQILTGGSIDIDHLTGAGAVRDVIVDPRDDANRAYVLMQSPETVLIADLGATTLDELALSRIVPVGSGPSHLELASFDVAGKERVLLFASCFDSREVYVIDVDLGRTLAVLRVGSGPFALAADPVRARLYVADFRNSVVHVASLAPLLECGDVGAVARTCTPALLGSIGVARPVEELQ